MKGKEQLDSGPAAAGPLVQKFVVCTCKLADTSISRKRAKDPPVDVFAGFWESIEHHKLI